MNRGVVLEAARDARLQLASDLRGLDAAQWSSPSLCASWTVRELVSHLVVLDDRIYRRLDRLVTGPIRHRGLNAFFEQDAKRFAAVHSDGEILAAFQNTRHESRVIQRYHIWPTFPLVEMVVHGQDIRRPLAMQHALPLDWLVTVANHLTSRFRKPWGAEAPVAKVRFEAVDADWSFGSGNLVRGPLEAIVMTMVGRSQALHDLSGAVDSLR